MSADALLRHRAALGRCRACPRMVGPVVAPPAVMSAIYLVGQAPGPHEAGIGRPFAWTAGRTLFRWFAGIGVDEAAFRARIYLAAVCRCFPGKAPGGGDRVPDGDEIAACARWMRRETALLRPELIIPVGRLAIGRWLPAHGALAEVVGRAHRAQAFGHAADVIPLPHPSGASTWHRSERGAALLRQALALIAEHPAWRRAFATASGTAAG